MELLDIGPYKPNSASILAELASDCWLGFMLLTKCQLVSAGGTALYDLTPDGNSDDSSLLFTTQLFSMLLQNVRGPIKALY
jgi:hypothetical protein